MTRAPDKALDPAIRRLRDEVIWRFRAGGELSHVHKEGGERLFFEKGLFICDRYGDNGESRERFADPERFLNFLWNGWSWQYKTRHDGPNLSDAEAWQRIVDELVHEHPTSSSPSKSKASANAEAVAFYNRYRRMLTMVAIGVAVAALAFAFFGKGLQIKTIGTPAGGDAIGTPKVVLILISQLEPYVPSLHRDRSLDRFRLSLLIQPRAAEVKRQLIEVARDYDAVSLQHASKAIGFDGRVAWFHAGGLTGWHVVDQKLITENDVRAANPDLNDFWDQAFLEINDGLIASTRDNQIIVRLDPESLKADYLSRMPQSKRHFPAHPVDALRTEIEPAEADARDTSWLRSGVDGPELRLQNPDSRIRIHRRKIDITQRMLVVTRIDDEGRELWSMETGIDTLHQILPDPKVLAFIGTRPPIPDKVPEPIITFVDTADGAVRTESLLFGK